MSEETEDISTKRDWCPNCGCEVEDKSKSASCRNCSLVCCCESCLTAGLCDQCISGEPDPDEEKAP